MSNNDASRKSIPPYVSYVTFHRFIEGLSHGVPGRVDASLLKTLSGTARHQLMTALRYLDLTDADGHTNSKLVDLSESDGEERQRVFRTILEDSYPSLFENFNLSNATVGQLEERFRRTGASGETIRKCLAFFTAAATEAGISLSPFVLKAARQRSSPTAAKPNGRKARTRRSSEQATPTTERLVYPTPMPDTMRTPSWQELLMSKFPNFDPEWPDEVKSQWFTGFHRLMDLTIHDPQNDESEENGEDEPI